MVQTLKPELRERILQAAREEFAAHGYSGATMASIAGRVGVSVGNIYRYFPNRDALFDAVLPDELVTQLLDLLQRRVGSLASAPILVTPGPEAEKDAEAFLKFLVAHRWEVVLLLDRAEGSRHAAVQEQFLASMEAPALTRMNHPTDPVLRLLVRLIFQNTIRALVGILESCTDEDTIRRGFAGFWSYQLAGLAGLMQFSARTAQER